ncbi:MAG: hypothetical protein ACM3SU_07160 [Acidobacteriota bacterium]
MRPTPSVLLRLTAVLLGLAAAGSPASARELHWRAVDVRARLDSAGALHVVERQAMVFTGDWNGGERIFRILPGQSLALEGLTRIGSDGQKHPLSAGDLSAVDQYAWKDARTLRWRSRLPSDPPFDRTEIVYEIAYALSGILVREGSGYLLDHDFVFPDRSGSIEKFTLALELDSAWRPARPLPPSFARGPLPPGESFVLRIPLQYTGAGRPGAVRIVAGRAQRLAAFLLLAAAAAALYAWFRAREKSLGRFASGPPPESIDARWLEANLFSLAPEEAGGLWDGKIGAPEVAAVLARLAAEKKIETRVEGKNLVMRLLAEPEHLSGYDGELVKGLFFGGRRETDVEAIRKHYRSTGFDPAAKIRPGLEQRVAALAEESDRPGGPPVWAAPVLFLLGAGTLALAAALGKEDPGTVLGVGFVNLILWGIGGAFALLYRRRADRSEAFSLVFLWVPLAVLLFAWLGSRAADPASPALVAGVFLLRLAILFGVFAAAKTREGPKRIARRKTLASARAFFARELSTPAPRLEDAWFPWIVAFGLTHESDRWARTYGAAGASSGSGSRSASSSSSGETASSPSSWTGGGGSFGGAGASASWAAAAGAVAAGVSAPSSSGGGGGGGGGGGSSGGGGGGGW